MLVELRTKLGSVYVLDRNAMTWARVKKFGKPCAAHGTLSEWPIINVDIQVQVFGPHGAGLTDYVQSWHELDALQVKEE